MKLEIGAGAGKYKFKPKLCPHCNVFIDIEKPPHSPEMFILCDARKLPFADEVFDKVIASHVLEHLENPQFVLTEVYRVLKPEGKVEAYVPNFTSRNAIEDLAHKQVFNYLSLKRLVTKCGFKTFIHFPTASRILPNLFGKVLLALAYGEFMLWELNGGRMLN